MLYIYICPTLLDLCMGIWVTLEFFLSHLLSVNYVIADLDQGKKCLVTDDDD